MWSGVATGWTGVDMSTQLLLQIVPEIDANPVSFHGGGSCRESVTFGAWLAKLQKTENEANLLLLLGINSWKVLSLREESPGPCGGGGGPPQRPVTGSLFEFDMCPPHIFRPGDTPEYVSLQDIQLRITLAVLIWWTGRPIDLSLTTSKKSAAVARPC